MTGLHLYAIIPSADGVDFDVAGVDDRDNVRAIARRDYAAVVSASPLVDYRGLTRDEIVRYLLTHQRVVETVMRTFPVLPVKFGTVLDGELRVRDLLDQGQTLFRATLAELEGRVQMEVVVLWNVQDVFDAIGEEKPIARLKAKIAARPPEETKEQRVAIGQMVQASLEERRARVRDLMIPLLEALALDVVINPLMDDQMVANVALLIDQISVGDVDAGLATLDSLSEGRFHFRCVGPLPPYSFATLEVHAPSFEEVDEARRHLGLGKTATPSEIKRAYRQLARELHPDHNINDPDAQNRMSQLAMAYERITAYTETQLRGVEDSGLAVCSFDRPVVEGTLAISLTRQESVG